MGLTIRQVLDDLRCDVPRGADLLLAAVAVHLGREAEVRQLKVSVVRLVRQQKVLGLEISAKI